MKSVVISSSPTMEPNNDRSEPQTLKDTAMMINAAAANVDHQQNKRSRRDDASSALVGYHPIRLLDFADFIAPAVSKFLGVCSLLSFGATCKSHRDVVAGEIVCRKACIMEIGDEVKRLIANQKQSTDLTQYINRIARESLRPGLREDVDYIQQQVEGDDEEVIVSNPTRDEILSAKKLLYRGIRLIDDELYSIHKKERLSSPPFDFWRSYHDFDQRNDDFYDQNIFREDVFALRSIAIFPNCFYFSPTTAQQGDNFNHMTRGAIRKASIYVSKEYIAIMVLGFEVGMAEDPDDVVPSDDYGRTTARCIADGELIDAFRIAAREFEWAVEDENIMTTLWNVINMVDNNDYHSIDGYSGDY